MALHKAAYPWYTYEPEKGKGPDAHRKLKHGDINLPGYLDKDSIISEYHDLVKQNGYNVIEPVPAGDPKHLDQFNLPQLYRTILMGSVEQRQTRKRGPGASYQPRKARKTLSAQTPKMPQTSSLDPIQNQNMGSNQDQSRVHEAPVYTPSLDQLTPSTSYDTIPTLPQQEHGATPTLPQLEHEVEGHNGFTGEINPLSWLKWGLQQGENNEKHLENNNQPGSSTENDNISSLNHQTQVLGEQDSESAQQHDTQEQSDFNSFLQGLTQELFTGEQQLLTDEQFFNNPELDDECEYLFGGTKH